MEAWGGIRTHAMVWLNLAVLVPVLGSLLLLSLLPLLLLLLELLEEPLVRLGGWHSLNGIWITGQLETLIIVYNSVRVSVCTVAGFKLLVQYSWHIHNASANICIYTHIYGAMVNFIILNFSLDFTIINFFTFVMTVQKRTSHKNK